MANLLRHSPEDRKKQLSRKTDVPFILAFKYPLQKGYTFSSLSNTNVIEFQRFLDKISKMTFDQVDKSFRRPTDKNDTFNDSQVIHHEVSKSFRIHGVIENARFKVLRLDPNHKYHC